MKCGLFLCFKHTREMHLLNTAHQKRYVLITKIISPSTNSTFKEEWNYITAVTMHSDAPIHSDMHHSSCYRASEAVDHLILASHFPSTGSWPTWTGTHYIDQCKIN
jgi:hypothetical protein